VSTDRFITSADWRTKGRSISPRPTDPRPGASRHQHLVDDRRRRPARQEDGEKVSSPSLSPATTFSASSSSGGIAGRFLSSAAASSTGFTSEKWRRKAFRGDSPRSPAVVDQVQADLPVGFRDLRHRQDLRRVDDRGVEPPRPPREGRRSSAPGGGRGEAEGDVAHAEQGEHAGELLLHPADRREGVRGGVDEGRVPDPTVKVRTSKRRSEGRSPYRCTARSWIARAVSTFSSTVIAIPFSWMVRAMTAAPYVFASRQTRSRFFPPSSRFTELTRHLPGWIFSAASMQSGWSSRSPSGPGPTARRAGSWRRGPPSRPSRVRRAQVHGVRAVLLLLEATRSAPG